MDIMNLIQNLMFPVACCVVLFKMLIDEKDAHKVESESFVQAINNNTAAIERIVDMMETLYDKHNIDREEIFNDECKTDRV